MNKALWTAKFCIAILLVGQSRTGCAQSAVHEVSVQVDWVKPATACRTTPTLQVVVNPLLRPGSRIHDKALATLKGLGTDYVRFVPWFPYPKLAVAELRAPTATQTSWDFSLIDPMTTEFLDATKGHSPVVNFSTIPAWLFKTDKPVIVQSAPEQVTWDYTQGTALMDPTGKALG